MYDFDISKYKRFARIQLKKRWTTPILMTLVATFVQLLLFFPIASYFVSNEIMRSFIFTRVDSHRAYRLLAESSLEMPSYVMFCLAAVFFVSAIFTIAKIYVYLKMARGPDTVSFSAFFEGLAYWWRAVRAMIWKNFWLYLWSLLFVVPGIIKSFSYSQVDFIVAEFPHIPVRKALTMSKKIMRGHKLDWFCLNLSFIGWFLLSLITYHVADLGIEPYFTMTRVNAYHAIMKDALDRGVIAVEDLSPRR